jgi:hypothetical protein
MNAARWAAAAVVVVTLAMDAGTVWVLFGTDFLSRFAQPGLTESYVVFVYAAVAGFGAVSTSYVLVGLLLSGRRGAGRIAAVLLAGGALLAATPFGYVVGGELAYEAPANALANTLFLIGPVAFGSAFSLIVPGLALVFPTGGLPSRRWRLPVVLVAAALGVGTAIELIRPGPIAGAAGSRNPFGIDGLPAGLLDATQALLPGAVVGFTIVGVAAVLTRYRHGDVTLRQQLRWFVVAVLLVAVPLPLSGISGQSGPFWGALACVGLLLVPVSVGIAVTRHRLYEIDRLLSRGLSWAVLSGLLVAVYAGAVLVLQSLLGGVTQGETVAVAGSTLLAAALFQPLRRRIQAAVDHRFNRARYDAERTVEGFADRLRDEVDLVSLSGDIARVVDDSLSPSTIDVWIRPPRPSTP